MSVEGYQVGSDFLQKQRRFTSFKITRRAQSELLLKTALQSSYGMKRFLLTLKKTFSHSKNFRRLSVSFYWDIESLLKFLVRTTRISELLLCKIKQSATSVTLETPNLSFKVRKPHRW